ncbi:MAG TPA: sulfotransferase [Microthrixaceae bacterium]|nr:sulfotransferase [Microthrixaceae bacterium]
MTWAPATRGPDAAEIYSAAEADRLARPERYRLDSDAVVERATRDGEIPESDFADGWRTGLVEYLASARDDGRLNALGTRMVVDTAVGRLVAGARTTEAWRAHPSFASSPLAPPIVIVGGWRTGTTFLSRLLATDPRLRGPLPAELTAPWRFVHADATTRERLIDKGGAAHDLLHVLNPTMAAVHPSGPRLPEECVLALGTDLRNWGFTSTVRLDSYAAWLADEDLTGSYERYRHALQLLSVGDERRWVLKAPAHTGELPCLAKAFPGAIVVHLHRDVVETIASGASLFAVFRSTYSDDVDPVDVGRFQAEQTERWFGRAAAFRSSSEASAVTIVDLDYEDLIADPSLAVRTVLAAADLEPSADLGAFVDEYHAANPRDAHGRHDYEPADFGLDPDELRARFVGLD